MPFFGKKSHDYELLSRTLTLRNPPHPSWEDAVNATSGLSGGVTGAVMAAVKQSGKSELTFLEEFYIFMESSVFALQTADRISFDHGGSEFRDAFTRFIEPWVAVAMIDSFLFNKSTSSKEEAKERPRQLAQLTEGEGGVFEIYDHYSAQVQIIGEGLKQEGTLFKVLVDRIGEIAGVGVNGPMAHLAMYSGVLGAIEESDCFRRIRAVEIITEAD